MKKVRLSIVLCIISLASFAQKKDKAYKPTKDTSVKVLTPMDDYRIEHLSGKDLDQLFGIIRSSGILTGAQILDYTRFMSSHIVQRMEPSDTSGKK